MNSVAQNNLFFTIILAVVSKGEQEFFKFYVLIQFCKVNLQLYVLVMSHIHFRVNPHSIVG